MIIFVSNVSENLEHLFLGCSFVLKNIIYTLFFNLYSDMSQAIPAIKIRIEKPNIILLDKLFLFIKLINSMSPANSVLIGNPTVSPKEEMRLVLIFFINTCTSNFYLSYC